MKGKETLVHAESINLTDNDSIFQAELIIIIEAAIHLTHYEETMGQYIKIFCDSQAALQALKSKKTVKKMVFLSQNKNVLVLF